MVKHCLSIKDVLHLFITPRTFFTKRSVVSGTSRGGGGGGGGGGGAPVFWGGGGGGVVSHLIFREKRGNFFQERASLRFQGLE